MAAGVGRLGRTERRQLGWFGIGLVAAGLAPLAVLVRRPDAARGELSALGPPALGTPLAVALHVSSDTLIALSYFAISAVLLYVVVRARRDIPFSGVLVA